MNNADVFHAHLDEWAEGGRCPYDDLEIERAANFEEKRDRWDPSAPLCTASSLVKRLIEEKMRTAF